MKILRKIRLEKNDIDFCDVCSKEVYKGADFYVELELFENFCLGLTLCEDCVSRLEAFVG